MDWASYKPGELNLPDSPVEPLQESGVPQAQLHWLLSATGIWEELRRLEEEQGKLQRTLQDVLRRRQVEPRNIINSPVNPAASGNVVMALAGIFSFCGFIFLNMALSMHGPNLEMLFLGGYVSVIVAVIAGALFSNGA